MKGTVVDGLKTGKNLQDFNVESSECQRSDLEVGQSTQKLLDKKPELANKEILGMRKFYQSPSICRRDCLLTMICLKICNACIHLNRSLKEGQEELLKVCLRLWMKIRFPRQQMSGKCIRI